ncbi:transcription regulator [Bacillus sp. J14TS2]|uniref:AraC family transcriptional regulator n=1 Tax=Bacillus sp. J14TS2 TaxID=2807188 RepID=UPI001B108F6E|nr:AraC family transcriptional regulator [Bacillus sp. J14TS2]GIN71824.1 transcription regulator [Bacillus sp. J14TS2]
MKQQNMNEVLRGKQFFTKRMFPFHIERYRILKDNYIPPHTHDFFELVYVVRGNAHHQIEDKTYELSAGNVFILEPSMYHRFRASLSHDTVVYNVLFNKEFLHRELNTLSTMPSFVNFFYLIPFLQKHSSFIQFLPLQLVQKIQIEKHLDAIYREYQEKEDGYQFVIKTRLIEVLILLSRYYKTNQGKQNIFISDDEAIQSIAHFLKEHCNQPISLSQLSKTFGISVSSLTAKFKAHTGKTLIEFKHTAQIQQACYKLQESKKKISTIALDSGFNDLSHFNRVFKKHTGTTPSHYRSNGGES